MKLFRPAGDGASRTPGYPATEAVTAEKRGWGPESFGEEKCLGMQTAGTKDERLLAMIEALGDKPLHAISIKRAHRISPVELRIRPPQSWMYCKMMEMPGQKGHICDSREYVT